MTEEDHREYLEYKQEIMMMDEQSTAKLKENVLCLFDAGETKTRIAKEIGISIIEACEIIDERSD